jgi:2-methylisocitrate lyase-like PEP mutase family enzyme
MKTQAEKAQHFAALHKAPGAFVIANAWDAGSARVLAGLGFPALATTSAGLARSIGRTDYNAGREAVLAHVRELAPATDLPLSGDLENGFGHSPEACAETIRLAAEAGLVGGSIEDATGDPSNPIYPIEIAAERMRAAAEAARALPHRFLLTGRAENYLHGRRDLADTIRRLQAYQEAGADVLFAPGVIEPEEVRTLCAAVDRPVNVLWMARPNMPSVAQLSELGVKRVSLGGLLQVAAMSGMISAARGFLRAGAFTAPPGFITGADLDALIGKGTPG